MRTWDLTPNPRRRTNGQENRGQGEKSFNKFTDGWYAKKFMGETYARIPSNMRRLAGRQGTSLGFGGGDAPLC